MLYWFVLVVVSLVVAITIYCKLSTFWQKQVPDGEWYGSPARKKYERKSEIAGHAATLFVLVAVFSPTFLEFHKGFLEEMKTYELNEGNISELKFIAFDPPGNRKFLQVSEIWIGLKERELISRHGDGFVVASFQAAWRYTQDPYKYRRLHSEGKIPLKDEFLMTRLMCDFYLANREELEKMAAEFYVKDEFCYPEAEKKMNDFFRKKFPAPEGVEIRVDSVYINKI